MSHSTPRPLPESPNQDWLQKEIESLRQSHPTRSLADAQSDLAQLYGFATWEAFKDRIDELIVQTELFEAARQGLVDQLAALLDRHPRLLHARALPYQWTLLHTAAKHGHLSVIELLLARGLDANLREAGDNTYAMHWAAAAGRLDIVRRLADAGGDVIGKGDDHDLEVIGWATCWDDGDDAAHREVAAFLISRGAKHHIFSAIALNLGDELRRMGKIDPSALLRRQSHNENQRTALQFAVLKHRPEMIALLLELGADPFGVDGAGMPVAAFPTSPEVDHPVMEKIRELAKSAASEIDHSLLFLSQLSLGDWASAESMLQSHPDLIAPRHGVLHMAAKRNDLAAVQWLLAHGADPNGLWSHWDAEVTPLHLASSRGHTQIVKLLLEARANPRIRDSKHDGDSIAWAEFFHQPQIVPLLKADLL